jgi:hypothetical protein
MPFTKINIKEVVRMKKKSSLAFRFWYAWYGIVYWFSMRTKKPKPYQFVIDDEFREDCDDLHKSIVLTVQAAEELARVINDGEIVYLDEVSIVKEGDPSKFNPN